MIRFCSFAFVFAFAGIASAQDMVPEVPESVEKKLGDDPEAEEGWKVSAKISATGSYNNTQNVVGAQDGNTIQIGGQLNAAANYRRGKSDWENSLSLNLTTSRTPAIDAFIKSTDELKLKSTYVYRLTDKIGPFAQVGAVTAILEGQDVRSGAFTAILDGETTDITANADGVAQVDLTNPFEPFTLNESAGFFAAPIEEKTITARLKLGVGGEHVISQDGFFLADDETTDAVEYNRLVSSNQAGAVFEGSATGQVVENVTYEFALKLFYAAVSDLDELDGSDRLSTEVDAKLKVSLSEAASLDYVLIVRDIPWISEETQVTNGVLLSIGYNLL
ncbi:MAG: DUF3078 domain-containing protein [Myxococcota bacterium]